MPAGTPQDMTAREAPRTTWSAPDSPDRARRSEPLAAERLRAGRAEFVPVKLIAQNLTRRVAAHAQQPPKAPARVSASPARLETTLPESRIGRSLHPPQVSSSGWPFRPTKRLPP